MNVNKNFWQEIKSSIKKELDSVDKLRKELHDELDNRSSSRRIIGSILHDFYNCCERIFRRISAEINGGTGMSEAWHKELLYRMTIEINEIRPRIISDELASELDDYLSFRHIFRNIYGFELKGERLDRLVEKFDRVSQKFTEEILEFLKKMERE